MNEYLKNVSFSPDEVPRGVRHYMHNMRIVVLLIAALLIGGFIVYRSLPQTVAPEINLSMVTVTTTLPGATPEDVESLITTPLEDEIKGLSGIDTVNSTSANSVSAIIITFVRGVEKSQALSDVENAVNRRSDLPDDASDPRVEAVDFENAPVVRWVVTASGESAVSLAQHADTLATLLEANPLIDHVTTAGLPQQEVQITMTPERMTALGVDIGALQAALRTAVTALPGGTVQSGTLARSLTIDAAVTRVADIRVLPITLGGATYALSDIATVTERPAPGTVASAFAKGDSEATAATLSVYRASGVDLKAAAENAETIAAGYIAGTNGAITKEDLENIAVDLTTQFHDLTRNLSITVVLVFITLMLFVGWRQALIAAFSIPLTYAVAFMAMKIAGVSINFLSLFSLLLSLGLLVDVTIVVTSAMTTYMRDGHRDARMTGLLVYRDFFVTLIITTLTTVWAFVPLLLAGGIIGEYIKPIPVIVSSVLLGSVFVGFFVILPLMTWLFDFSMPRRVKILLAILGLTLLTGALIAGFNVAPLVGLPLFLVTAMVIFAGHALIRRSSWIRMVRERFHALRKHVHVHSEGRSMIPMGALERRYRKILENILTSRAGRRRTIAMVVIFFVFSFALIPAGLVKNEFFPGADENYLYVSLEMPNGTTADETARYARTILPQLANTPGITSAVMEVAVGLSDQGNVSSGSGDSALFTLLTPKKGDGGLGSQRVAQTLRTSDLITQFTGGTLSVVERSGGPPAGADVVVTFLGDDLETLRVLSQDLAGRLEGMAGVTHISVSPEPAAASVTFVPEERQLVAIGISRTALAQQLRLAGSGIDLASDVYFDDTSDKRDIVLRLSSADPHLTTLARLHVATPAGSVPLTALGTLRLQQNLTRVAHEDFDRTMTVTADVESGYNAVDINHAVATLVDTQMQLPTGYAWRSGGANEENNKSVQSILQGMLVAFTLIFLTLIIHLGSYRKAAIVLLTIPLAASGVFIIFALFGIPLSFPALIGVLALFGIVVNNAIIVIAQINANRAVGMGYHRAIVDGATSRLEPIVLSSLTTIIGLLPITLSDPLWQGLGGAIIAGLIFSGTIMLFFIPTVYELLMRDEKMQNR